MDARAAAACARVHGGADVTFFRWLTEEVPAPRYYVYGFWVFAILLLLNGVVELTAKLTIP